MSGVSITRRALLRSGALAGVAGLAGCGDNQAGTQSDGDVSPPSDSVFQDVTVDGQHLVVELREGHDVSGLNLIGPDGRLYTQTSVATGETQATLQLTQIEPGLGGYEHYEPGTHELVTKTDEETTSFEIDLVPNLQVADIHQYRSGDRNSDFGKVAVKVVNTGTGPSWVHDVAFQNAPYHAANNPLSDDPGVPMFTRPKKASNIILNPGESQVYVSTNAPFLFDNESVATCSGGYAFSVLLATATGDTHSVKVTTEVDGEPKSVGLVGQYSCDNVTIDEESSLDPTETTQNRGGGL